MQQPGNKCKYINKSTPSPPLIEFPPTWEREKNPSEYDDHDKKKNKMKKDQ